MEKENIATSTEELLDIMNEKTSEEEQEDSPASSQDEKEEEKEEEESPSHQGDDDSEDDSKEEESEEESENDDEDKDTPFHQHPRFKEVISQKNELKDKLKEKDDELDKMNERLTSIENNNQSVDSKEDFVKLFGDSEEAFNTWSDMSKKERKAILGDEDLLDKLADRVYKKTQSFKSKEQTKIEEADNFVKDEMQRLKDEGNKFNEKKLKDIMVKYQPGDGDQLDFNKGLDILNVMETSSKKTKQTRKAIADATTSKNTTTKEPEYYTPGFSRQPGF